MSDGNNQYLVIGLGNPGTDYKQTRHNIGFIFLDYLAEQFGADNFKENKKFEALVSDCNWNGFKILLAKPQTYMNESGSAAAKISTFYKIKPDHVIVVYDDVDLPFAKIRVKANGGHGGHNGIKSLQKELGSSDFLRVKVGIGRPENSAQDTSSWVLGKFNEEQSKELSSVNEKVFQAVQELILNGVLETQNKFN